MSKSWLVTYVTLKFSQGDPYSCNPLANITPHSVKVKAREFSEVPPPWVEQYWLDQAKKHSDTHPNCLTTKRPPAAAGIWSIVKFNSWQKAWVSNPCFSCIFSATRATFLLHSQKATMPMVSPSLLYLTYWELSSVSNIWELTSIILKGQVSSQLCILNVSPFLIHFLSMMALPHFSGPLWETWGCSYKCLAAWPLNKSHKCSIKLVSQDYYKE